MTKVYYTIGDHRYDSYKNAKIASSFARKPIVTHYEPVYEETKVDVELVHKRVEKLREKAQARA